MTEDVYFDEKTAQVFFFLRKGFFKLWHFLFMKNSIDFAVYWGSGKLPNSQNFPNSWKYVSYMIAFQPLIWLYLNYFGCILWARTCWIIIEVFSHVKVSCRFHRTRMLVLFVNLMIFSKLPILVIFLEKGICLIFTNKMPYEREFNLENSLTDF